jgi:hypothetical protein
MSGWPLEIAVLHFLREEDKGDSPLMCEASFGPFRQRATVTFSAGRER